MPHYFQRTAIGTNQSGQHTYQRGFTCPIRPKQRKKFASLNREIYSAQSMELVIMLVRLLDFNGGHMDSKMVGID